MLVVFLTCASLSIHANPALLPISLHVLVARLPATLSFLHSSHLSRIALAISSIYSVSRRANKSRDYSQAV